MKKITKWGIGLVMAIAMIFMAGQASAAVVGLYETGQLVPKVYHDGANVDTVVGLQCTAVGGCDVYWAFFDVDSGHVTDGMIPMTQDEYHGFSWMAESGAGLDDVEGYMVFTSGTPGFTPTGRLDIFANAFMVDVAGKDAVLVPVLPLTAADYDAAVDLTAMTATSIISLTAGSPVGAILDIHYWIDPLYNAATTIIFWSVCDVSPLSPYNVNVYDDTEDRKSVNIDIPNEELNMVDAATITGMPVAFIDGFLRFTVPAAVCVGPEVANDMFVFSYVDSDLIGAMQTLLAGE